MTERPSSALTATSALTPSRTTSSGFDFDPDAIEWVICSGLGRRMPTSSSDCSHGA